MHPHASAAIRAVRNIRSWGVWATGRFLAKRGVPLRLTLLALRLESSK